MTLGFTAAGWPGRTLLQALPGVVGEVSRGGRGRTNGIPRGALPSVTWSSRGCGAVLAWFSVLAIMAPVESLAAIGLV